MHSWERHYQYNQLLICYAANYNISTKEKIKDYILYRVNYCHLQRACLFYMCSLKYTCVATGVGRLEGLVLFHEQ